MLHHEVLLLLVNHHIQLSQFLKEHPPILWVKSLVTLLDHCQVMTQVNNITGALLKRWCHNIQ